MIKILLVEDVDDIRENASELLELSDFEVITASNGIQALEQLSSHKVDLIISDVVMPHMDGFEFMDKLRENDHLKNIPFIYMSASVQAEEKDRAIDKGIDGFIQKPFTEEVLLAAIKKALKKD